MGNTHKSKHYRESKRSNISERDKMMRKRNRLHQKSLREKARRDKKVTAEFDFIGHHSCGRKTRYHSRTSAENYIRTHYSGKTLSCYKCSICGGWHLTSHHYDATYTSDEVGSELTVKEVFDAAREAALEIRRIEEQTQVKRELLGAQGHSYDFHSKNGILDPTRKIDDLIMWEAQQINADELRQPIDDACDIVDGISKVADDLCVELVTRYYLQAESWVEIARDLGDSRHIGALDGLVRGEQVSLLKKTMSAAMSEWDAIGLARLKELGKAR